MYKTLKTEQLAARKDRANGKPRASLLTGVIGDIDEKTLSERKAAESSDELYITPDSTVVAVLKNQIKNLNKGISETIAEVGDCDAVTDMKAKIAALSEFLPQAVEGDELRLLIQGLEASSAGKAMGLLKKASIEQSFDYDGKEAFTIASEIFV